MKEISAAERPFLDTIQNLFNKLHHFSNHSNKSSTIKSGGMLVVLLFYQAFVQVLLMAGKALLKEFLSLLLVS
jgi:hypothetical protein